MKRKRFKKHKDLVKASVQFALEKAKSKKIYWDYIIAKYAKRKSKLEVAMELSKLLYRDRK